MCTWHDIHSPFINYIFHLLECYLIAFIKFNIFYQSPLNPFSSSTSVCVVVELGYGLYIVHSCNDSACLCHSLIVMFGQRYLSRRAVLNLKSTDSVSFIFHTKLFASITFTIRHQSNSHLTAPCVLSIRNSNILSGQIYWLYIVWYLSIYN